jgi:beta-glucuronidase
VNRHTEVFREFPEVAGAIYFDYNDYRTQIGDKGAGAFRQRVHGVVDVYAGRKPSFEALRRQASPIKELTLTVTGREFTLQIETRNLLPGYILRGYGLRWLFYGYDDLPMEGQLQPLAQLVPGQSVSAHATPVIPGVRRVAVDILRPTGYSVATAEIAV